MSRFVFRLRSLLRLREAARDERREQLAEALSLEQTLREQAEQLQHEREMLRTAITARVGPIDVDRLIDGQRYEMLLVLQQQKLAQQLEAVFREIERRRGELIAADREVKVLERYHERQQARHQEQEAQREQKQFDEIAGQRHQREVQPW